MTPARPAFKYYGGAVPVPEVVTTYDNHSVLTDFDPPCLHFVRVNKSLFPNTD